MKDVIIVVLMFLAVLIVDILLTIVIPAYILEYAFSLTSLDLSLKFFVILLIANRLVFGIINLGR